MSLSTTEQAFSHVLIVSRYDGNLCRFQNHFILQTNFNASNIFGTMDMGSQATEG